MGKDEKLTATPRLRFPEFREAEGWEARPLESLCDVLNSRRRPISSEKRSPGQYAYYGASGIVDFINDYIFDERLLLIGEDGAKWGRFEKTAFIADGRYWVNNHAHVLKAKEVNDAFLENYLTMADLSRFVTGAAPPKLTLGKLKTIPIPLPPSNTEQQKIADCLTSLDEVIAAQGRKVAALAAHKRGLMQQLFPREGETLPRLRFPAFRDAPEGKITTLGEVLEVASGQVNPTEPPYCDLSHVGGDNIESHTGNLRAIATARELQLISGKYLFDEGDVLYSKIRPALNKVALPDFKGICSADIYPLRPAGGNLTRIYLACVLRSEAFLEYAKKLSDRSKIPKINREALLDYEVPLPTFAEQQRIADCLSSLDAQIAAASAKLAALKTHKRGLMQQLFRSAP